MPKLIKLNRQLLLAAVLLCALAPAARAQAAAPAATIAGRVSDGEHGLPGVMVILVYNEAAQRFRLAARVKTDAEGRFLFANVAPARYLIMPVAPAHIVEGAANNFPPGRPLTVNAGEEIKDIDFRLEAGGVITGRVTDADGNPVVGEQVTVMPVEERPGQPRPVNFNFDPRDQMTDDRGVYRLFGLPAGRYRVSVGRAGDSGAVSYGGRKLFRRTFYPNATEEAQARIVELKTGIESTDVDITVGSAVKTYKVSGRFVTADTGQPVSDVAVAYTTVDAKGRRMGGYGSGTLTNARGEFSTDGLAPGRYAVYVSNNFFRPGQTPTEFYSDPVFFEVTDGDVSGLLVKLKRGASVSGVVQIEGLSDRAALAQMLSAVRVYAFAQPDRRSQVAMGAPMRPVNVNPDGTFYVGGLGPGKLRLGTLNDTVKGLTTARIEMNGAPITNGNLDVNEGAQLNGVRIVMLYGAGTIVGQTSFVNGAPPPGARMMAVARTAGATPGEMVSHRGEVDARGFFRIEGVPPGEYEVIINLFTFDAGGGGRLPRSEPLRVHVGEGGEVKVAPVINFQPQPQTRKEP